MAGFKRALRRWLWSKGWDVARFDPATHVLARRRDLVTKYGVDLVLDVGANAGQYAEGMRMDVGYRGRIISFEPVSTAFARLARKAAGDEQWRVENYGLGDVNQSIEINIAANSYSSSVLAMLPSHLSSAPESGYTGKEVIDIRTLDSIEDPWLETSKNTYLKIDTQGFERQVLLGGQNRLKYIDTVQLEMSLVSLYQGESLFPDLDALLKSYGYRMVAIEPGFMDRSSGELLQFDGIYHRG